MLRFVSTEPGTKKQTWHKLGETWGEARPEYERLVKLYRTSAYLKRRRLVAESEAVPLSELRGLLRNATKNGRTRGLAVEIDLDHMRELSDRARGRCELSGIKFEYGCAPELRGRAGRRRRLWAPSLDRIDSGLGYVVGNVRLVCFAVNAARQEFGDEVLLKIAHALVNIQSSAKNSQGKIRSKAGRNGHTEFTSDVL